VSGISQRKQPIKGVMIHIKSTRRN